MAAKFLADQNFNNQLLRIVRQRVRDCDVVRTQDLGLEAMSDPALLARAAAQGRVLITHDADTLVGFAWERVKRSEPMPGVIVVRSLDSTFAVAEDLVLSVECGHPEDFRDRVTFLPY